MIRGLRVGLVVMAVASTNAAAGPAVTARTCTFAGPTGDSLANTVRGIAAQGDKLLVLDGTSAIRRYELVIDDKTCTLREDATFGTGGKVQLQAKGTATLDQLTTTPLGTFVSGFEVQTLEGAAGKRYCADHVSFGDVFAMGDATYLGGFIDDDESTHPQVYKLAAGCKATEVKVPAGSELVGATGDALVLAKKFKLSLFDPATGRQRALAGELLPEAVAACGTHVCAVATGVMTSHELVVWNPAGKRLATLDVWKLAGTQLWPHRIATVGTHVFVAGGIQQDRGFVGGIVELRGL